MKDKNTMNRREALTMLGAASAVGIAGAAFTGEVSAQSSSLAFTVRTYRLFIQPNPQYSWSARLIVKNAPYQCSLLFIKTGNNIPQNSISVDGLSGNFYLPENMLESVMELIRREAPIRVTIAGGSLIGTIANEQDEEPGNS